MLNITALKIDGFVDHLLAGYRRQYSDMEPNFPGMIDWIARTALECLANTDALYHNIEHTIHVAAVGHEIMRGKHLTEGGVTPRDWLNYMVALLCHDIGYVRGICRRDDGVRVDRGDGERLEMPEGSTDASLAPYHVDRSKLFVRERFGRHDVLDAEMIAMFIESTRFPPKPMEDPAEARRYPGLVRAADFIGQLADPHYLMKIPALYYELQESGGNEKLGYRHPGDLRERYAKFFWDIVHTHIRGAVGYLRLTEEGKLWVANLHTHVLAVEHHMV